MKDTTIVLKGKAEKLGIDVARWWKATETDDNFLFMVYKVAHDGHRRIVMDREVKDWMEESNGKIMTPPYYGYGWIQVSGVDVFSMRLDDFLGWCDPSFFGATPGPKKKKIKKLNRKPKKVLKKIKKLKRIK